MSLEEIGKTLNCDKTLLSVIYHNSRLEQDESDVVSILNKMLSSSKSRLKGLELLSANIENLPTEIVLGNANLWLNICVDQHNKSLRELKMTIIGKIIETCYKEQDFTKKLLSDYMTKILEMCLCSQVNRYEMECALQTLKICMKRFGSWFGAYRARIEVFLLRILFSQSIDLTKMAAEAFLQVQQVS